MTFVGRKITRARWEPSEAIPGAQLRADSVTDLRTARDSLSVWRCGDEDGVEPEQIVLAMASSFERLDKFDCAWTSLALLESLRVGVRETPGETLVDDLRERHLDLGPLGAAALLSVAAAFRSSLDEKCFKRFSKSEVAGILTRAVDSGRLLAEQLEPRLRDDLKLAT